MKLPGFRVPFLRRTGKGVDGVSGAPPDPHVDGAADRPRRWPLYLVIFAYLLVFGGAGGLGGAIDPQRLQQLRF